MQEQLNENQKKIDGIGEKIEDHQEKIDFLQENLGELFGFFSQFRANANMKPPQEVADQDDLEERRPFFAARL